VSGFERSDPLTGDALRTLVERDFIPLVPGDAPLPRFLAPPDPIQPDPAIVDELIAANRASVAALRLDVESKTGSALVDAIDEDIPEMKRILFEPRSHQVFMLAMEAAGWLTDVVSFLRCVDQDDFLDEVSMLEGGPQARDAIRSYLDAYGMRCVGEIDITRPRWAERPSVLVPVILAHIDNFEAGEAERRFEQGRVEAERKEREVLARLRTLPGGDAKADETKQMIDRVRTFIGYREYPKYGMVSRYLVYKQALLGEAERLVQAGVLREMEDLFFLTFPEIRESCARRRPTGGSSASAKKRSRRTTRSFHPACSPPTARRLRAPTAARTCRRTHSSACRCRPGRSRGAPA